MGGVGIVSGYGLTEAPIIAMASVRDSDAHLANTAGRATGTTQLRIVTLEGKEAGIGEGGEIRAHAPQMMKGYPEPSLTAAPVAPDGRLRTCHLDPPHAEDMLTITGRLKAIIHCTTRIS